MKNFNYYLVLISVILVIGGCAYQNYKWIKVDGKEINTPYGKANANMYYESKLCFPKCGELVNTED